MSALDLTTLWSGWKLRSKSAPEADELFSARMEGEDRYAFLAVAARGFAPPDYLTIQILRNQEHASADPGDGPLRRSWSLEYRQIAETAPRRIDPYGMYLLGVNPPEGMSDEEADLFNAFYTETHMPEVAERRHALRAVRFELVRELQPPYQGAPRFLAAYEVDEAGASSRRHVGPPYSKGPDVWQRHKTPWRLWYRLMLD